MEFKHKKNMQSGCADCRKPEPSALRKALNIFNSRTTDIPLNTLTQLSSEERKTARAHQLEVERRRSLAIEYSRHNTYR